MTDFHGFSAQGIAVANGMIGMHVLENLVSKGILSRAEARGILQAAIDSLMPKQNVVSVGEAIRIIRDQMLPQFTE